MIKETAIVATIGLGLLLYWHLKWRSRDPEDQERLDSFFLAGGKLGEKITAHNNLGLGLSFANAIWYLAFLGFYFGPVAFVLQLPWTLSIICIAVLVRRYVAASRSGTVHGFIRTRHGLAASQIAAFATVIGYTLNVGFEMFYSTHLLTRAFGFENFEFFLAVFVGAVVGPIAPPAVIAPASRPTASKTTSVSSRWCY